MKYVFSENLAHLLHGAAFMFFLIMSISLYRERKKNDLTSFLFLVFAAIGVLLVKDLCDLVGGAWESKYIINLSSTLDMFLSPMIVGLLVRILAPKWATVRHIAIMFAPSIVLSAAYAVTGNDIVFTAAFIYSTLLAAVGAYYAITASLRYDRLLKNNFSETKNKSVSWVWRTTVVLAAWCAAWGVFAWQDSWWVDSAYYVFLIFIWLVIYSYAVNHIAVKEIPDMKLRFPWRPRQKTHSSALEQILSRDLRECMEKKRLWLNPVLTLNDLSKAMGTNRTYLSAYLNNTLHTTFYDYLNSFRIKEACFLLSESLEKSLEEIAEQSGFNSFSTFRRAFYKYKKCSPAQYRKNRIS